MSSIDKVFVLFLMFLVLIFSAVISASVVDFRIRAEKERVLDQVRINLAGRCR